MAIPAIKLTPEQIVEQGGALDILYWLRVNKIKFTEGMPYTLDGHLYQVDPIQCNARKQCMMKSAQWGATAMWILKVMHGLIYGKYKQGAMYLFPTGDDAHEFTKARFDPLIAANSVIAQYVRNTDNASMKRIANAMLYLHGARATTKIGGSSGKKSSTKLKSAPVDIVVFDEVDEMDVAMILLALARMFHSKVRQEAYLSTPTIPDHGIDRLYNTSDMRVWMIRCKACNHETCLEMEFPDCLGERRVEGKLEAFRKCMKCGKEIFTRDGYWLARFPERAEDMVGWWISALNSAFISPTEILQAFRHPPDGNLGEVYNSMLGMPYIDTENRLGVNQVNACCREDVMAENSDGPACMGVDVGKALHYVIGVKPSVSLLKVIKIGKIEKVKGEDPFNHLHKIAQEFGVRCTVIDKYPETNKVRDFQTHEKRNSVYLCGYQEGKQRGPTAWNDKDQEIYGNRTELLDASHELVAHSGRLELPVKGSSAMEDYAKQMTNVAKILHEDRDTGDKIYKFVTVGTKEDHYRHATNYCMLASEKIGTQNISKLVAQYWRIRRRGTAWTR
ncbi:hypothetical protein LCGC14_1020800 [marine sediment metagenome]|uniref:Phage terminase large subunit GpA ATPase domain-containing protein n=1 Tax=marine sediment metagenome TaxID=412755 RepID=A0A0F9NJ35_9ZZZZ